MCFIETSGFSSTPRSRSSLSWRDDDAGVTLRPGPSGNRLGPAASVRCSSFRWVGVAAVA